MPIAAAPITRSHYSMTVPPRRACPRPETELHQTSHDAPMSDVAVESGGDAPVEPLPMAEVTGDGDFGGERDGRDAFEAAGWI